MSCNRSGIAAPKITTLVVDPANPSTTALVVSPTCEETEIKAIASEEPGEYRIKANNLSIGAILSVPSVQSLFVADNAITVFNGNGSTLKEIDLTNNKLTSLEKIQLPATLKRLYLDFNQIKQITPNQLPSSLSELLFRKAAIQSLQPFVFPNKLDRLILSGNRQLKSLYGLELPSSVSYFECSDGVVTEVVGVSFPKSLQTMIIGESPLTAFDFRASDLPTLKSMTIQASSVANFSCTDIRSNLTKLSSTLSGCVFTDLDFADKYPPLSESSSSRSSFPSTPSPAAASGESTPTPPKTSSGGSNSSQILVGALVLVAVVIGAIIAFVFQRRRKAKRDVESDGEVGKDRATRTQTAPWSDGGNLSHDSHSNGFFENDVRNDPELIAYRLRPEEISIMSRIAKGGFGIVFHAKLGAQDVVVKQISPEKAESIQTLRQFMDEIRLHSRLDHAKIVRFVGLCWTSLFDLGLVLEHMSNGDLRSFLLTQNQSPRTRQRFSWFNETPDPCCKSMLATDIGEALVYLHSFVPPIIHRDLKAKNVLLSADYTAKIGDFGISRETVETTMTGGRGTTAWIAPEVLQGERYSEKADIYSFGILMSELDACDHPYTVNRLRDASLTDAKIAYLVSTAALKPMLQDDCPPSIHQIILQCLDFNPANRPTAVELHYQLRKALQATRSAAFV